MPPGEMHDQGFTKDCDEDSTGRHGGCWEGIVFYYSRERERVSKRVSEGGKG
jgi:hypothetical protein